jgi:hypothetical protein
MRSLGSDRDHAVQRLQDAYAEGHLSHEDLSARLDQVLSAGNAEAVLAAVDSLPDPAPGRVVRVVAINGRIRRSGPWPVPRVLQIESEFGSVRLDFVRAAFESPVVDLELQLRFGGALLVVPADAVVDLDGLRTDWKQPRYTLPARAATGGPLIRVTGAMEFGRLKVRHAR